MKKLLISFAFAIVIAFPVYAGFADFFNGVEIGAPLPENDLQFLGATAATADHIVLIDFWATWCEPCRESIPRLNMWHEKFGAKGLVIIGVSQESKKVVDPFLGKLPMHYATAIEGSKSLHKALGIKALPYAIFVNRAGKIVWRGQPSEITDELILSLLAK
ncbi:MAG: TlpA family protein disulfide reductase [Betaproteobacteria bacterium]|nr:TlpA family protein disulfide reductase [Betaproteobacteria bacterium]